jgi:hypothetical protein
MIPVVRTSILATNGGKEKDTPRHDANTFTKKKKVPRRILDTRKNDQTHMSRRYFGSCKHFLRWERKERWTGQVDQGPPFRSIFSSGLVNSASHATFFYLPLCTLSLLQPSERNPQRLILLPALVPKGIDGKVYT